MPICQVNGCKKESLKNRIICYYHAYPADRDKQNDRRAAIKATKTKVSLESDDDIGEE